MNLYEYVKTTPLIGVDPTGLSKQAICKDNFGSMPKGCMGDPYEFLEHYIMERGDRRLTECQANAVMDNRYVREEIDEVLKVAMNRARRLKCKDFGSIEGGFNRQEITLDVSGGAVADGTWRLIIQQFSYKGFAACRIQKDCCCRGCKHWYAVQVACTFYLFARDKYDFHLEPLIYIPGRPYWISWDWESPRWRIGCVRDRNYCKALCCAGS